MADVQIIFHCIYLYLNLEQLLHKFAPFICRRKATSANCSPSWMKTRMEKFRRPSFSCSLTNDYFREDSSAAAPIFPSILSWGNNFTFLSWLFICAIARVVLNFMEKGNTCGRRLKSPKVLIRNLGANVRKRARRSGPNCPADSLGRTKWTVAQTFNLA